MRRDASSDQKMGQLNDEKQCCEIHKTTKDVYNFLTAENNMASITYYKRTVLYFLEKVFKKLKKFKYTIHVAICIYFIQII